MTIPLARQCRRLVFSTAKKYEIPAVDITAHIRSVKADAARIEVWREMVNVMGMSRQLVADSFGRDRRRLRASVLEKCPRILLLPTPKPQKRAPSILPRPTVPFQPVGEQLVWNFAVPLVITEQSKVERFIKPVPARIKQDLDREDRKKLVRFYEREARELRRSAVGV